MLAGRSLTQLGVPRVRLVATGPAKRVAGSGRIGRGEVAEREDDDVGLDRAARPEPHSRVPVADLDPHRLPDHMLRPDAHGGGPLGVREDVGQVLAVEATWRVVTGAEREA